MDNPEKTEEGQTGTEAEGQVEGQQAEGQTEGEAKTEEPKTVPYERFQEMAAKVKQLEEQATIAQQQMALAKANPPQGQQSVQQPVTRDIFKEVGLNDDDDVPTVKQHRQILEHYGKVFDTRLAELAFFQTHPDYTDLVGTADECMSGKYAEPLATAIKQNPALIQMIAQSGNPRLAAYEVAKLQKAKTKTDAPVKTNEAKTVIDEAVENANRVKSSSNAKGGEALSEKGRIENMPDKDFLELARKHGAFV